MPIIEYTSFFNGNSSDERLAPNSSILESKSVDWTSTSLGICNWPKVNKQIQTAMKPYFIHQDSDGITNMYIVWHDGTTGYIYRADNADNTPTVTVTDTWQTTENTTGTAYNRFEFIYRYNNGYFLVWKWSNGNYNIHHIAWTIESWTYTYNLVWWDVWTSAPPCFLKSEDNIYIGLWSWVFVVSSSWTSPFYDLTRYSLIEWSVAWITKHGTTFLVYTNRGEVIFWDWSSSTWSATNALWFIPRNVTQAAKYDFLSDHEWNMHIGTWYSMTKVTQSVLSKRLDDNSGIKTNNNINTWNWFSSISIGLWQFFWTWDDVKGIYQYNNILPWQNSGLFKVISTDNAHNDLTEVSCIDNNRFSPDRVYFAYYNGSTYWVDYVDYSTREKTRDWSFVTQVFVWNVMEIQELKQVQAVVSNTSWNNYVKVYTRIDNGSWTEIMDINEATDIITRVESFEVIDRFQEIQFKVELHNDTQWTDWPILHWLLFEYDEIEKI